MAYIMILIAYLLGSLSTSIILAKLLKQPDPRTSGSGNAGATNVLRQSGKQQAAYVLLGDVLKGLLAVLLARVFGVTPGMLGIVAFAAVLGHIFPLFFKFKGGKGVATCLGALLGLSFLVGLISALVWLAIALIIGYSSLASLVAIVVALVLTFFFANNSYLLGMALIAAIIYYKHKDNVERLRNKTEPKIDFSQWKK